MVVATGPRLYREYLLRSLSEHRRVHLVTDRAPDWECRYVDDATVLPLDGPDAVTTALRGLVARHVVRGVLTWSEARVVATAAAADALQLPGPGLRAAVNCRDKARTRAALAARGVPQPASVPVTGPAQARAAAQRLGYPVVVKPRGGAASDGVAVVRDADELEVHLPASDGVTAPDLPATDATVLVEEFVRGPEISVDAVVRSGRVHPVYLAHKEIGYAPHFEETGHVVQGRDPLLSDPVLRSVLDEAHAALGFRDGWTHTELRLSDTGPRVIEVNARLGGDLIPHLGERASGIAAGPLAAAAACGEDLELPVVPGGATDRWAAVRFAYPPGSDALLESVEVDEGAVPAGVDLVMPLVPAGVRMSPPSGAVMDGRVALAIGVADSRTACLDAVDGGLAAVRCRWGA
ncbi:carboxylase [Actinomycetospora sp. NBRC 106378]|nr:carboxylase [Actinomycetospora sp. NBRC 106378]